MKMFITLLALCSSSFLFGTSTSTATSLSSSVHSITHPGKKHGEFKMLALGAKNSVLLSNNRYYQPTREDDAKLIENWKIDDPIRVIKAKQDHRYFVANLRTGESFKARIFNWR